MRVTNSMVLRSTMHDLNQSLGRLQRSQTVLATGRQVSKPSDDPGSASAAMRLRTQLRQTDQQSRSLDDARGWLGTADVTLVSSLDLMSRVKELTVQASNTGAGTPVSRAALASEMRNIREELLGLANTQFAGRSVFNGSASGAAYDTTSGAYLGNAASVRRDVAPDVTLTVNITGEEVFGSQSSPTGDVFAVLDRLATAIGAGDTDLIAAEHINLDQARTRLDGATGSIGSRGARLESIRVRQAQSETELRLSLSSIEDADMAEALINVRTHENAYTAALQSAAQVIPPSLLDFLR